MKTEECELTTLCLLREGTKILLQDRLASDWAGWTLPGGHVEPGESVTAACVRETEEESGLRPLDPRLCGVKQFPGDNGTRYLVFLFTADRYEGELQSSPEGEMRWFERTEISAIPTVADLPLLISMMEDPAQNEFQYVIDDQGCWNAVIR